MNVSFFTPKITKNGFLKTRNNKFGQNPITPALAFLGNDEYKPSPSSSSDDTAKQEYIKYLNAQLENMHEIRDFYSSGRQYEEKLQNHPSVAFLYNPDLSAKEKLQILDESESVFSRAGLAKKMGLHPEKIFAWIENGNFDTEKISYLIFGTADSYYIDTELPKNKAFIEYVESTLPHAIPGEDLLMKYNFSQDEIKSLVKSGKLKPVGFDNIPEKNCGPYNLLFDAEDEINRLTIQRHLRITPLMSSKYGEGKRRFVPVNYLQKLGYGSAQSLYKLVQSGKLPGKIMPADEGKLRVSVDIGAKNAQLNLSRLRGLNPDIISAEEFRKECGLTKSAFKEAVLDGEIEIIREYIFKDDSQERLVNRKNPKNQGFLDKILFEQQLIEERKAEKRAKTRQERIARIQNPIESLRRTLVWSMCPYTKMVAGEIAKKDGHASKILGKISEEGREKLNREEEIKYKSYCKSFWAMAGGEEYGKAHARAKEIIADFKAGGIEAVKDPEARKVIADFIKEYGEI